MSVVFSPSLLFLKLAISYFGTKPKKRFILYVVTTVFAVVFKSNTFFNTTLIQA